MAGDRTRWPPNSPPARARAGRRRTLFVVGDKKQSIYSFQGADVAAFDRMQRPFRRAVLRRRAGAAAAGAGTFVPLVPRDAATWSIRPSTIAINRGAGRRRRSISPFTTDLPGRVDLWPVIAEDRQGREPGTWYRSGRSAARRPSHGGAGRARSPAEIRRMIDSGVQIPDEGRRRARCMRAIS